MEDKFLASMSLSMTKKIHHSHKMEENPIMGHCLTFVTMHTAKIYKAEPFLLIFRVGWGIEKHWLEQTLQGEKVCPPVLDLFVFKMADGDFTEFDNYLVWT